MGGSRLCGSDRIAGRQVAIIPRRLGTDRKREGIISTLRIVAREGKGAAEVGRGDGYAVVTGIIGETGVGRISPGTSAGYAITTGIGQIRKEVLVTHLDIVKSQRFGSHRWTAFLDDTYCFSPIVKA